MINLIPVIKNVFGNLFHNFSSLFVIVHGIILQRCGRAMLRQIKSYLLSLILRPRGRSIKTWINLICSDKLEYFGRISYLFRWISYLYGRFRIGVWTNKLYIYVYIWWIIYPLIRQWCRWKKGDQATPFLQMINCYIHTIVIITDIYTISGIFCCHAQFSSCISRKRWKNGSFKLFWRHIASVCHWNDQTCSLLSCNLSWSCN